MAGEIPTETTTGPLAFFSRRYSAGMLQGRGRFLPPPPAGASGRRFR